MGYRSELGIAIKATALTKLVEGDSNLTDNVKKCLSSADNHIISDNGNHLFLWDDIKWYGSYEHIAALISRFNDIDDESYRFVRLGEENSDIEIFGEWYENDFDLECVRQIYYHK